MHITTRNVNTGFRKFVELFHRGHADGPGEPIAVREPYSNPNGSGHVLRIPGPVTITYTHPRERVLFNAVRDANPFLHLYEVLWMLAGRNDVDSVAYYAAKMKEFSDDGKTLNGAYGYRWRKAGPKSWGSVSVYEGEDGNGPPTIYDRRVDQLDVIVNHLKADPTSRRAVLQMWNVEDDLLKIGGPRNYAGDDLPGSKDVCCNLSVMFALRKVNTGPGDYGDEYRSYLDMTVTNRSNDLLWGTFGSDYVTFSILQEYMAARLGAEVGLYHHFTNNLHVYADRKDWRPEELLAGAVERDTNIVSRENIYHWRFKTGWANIPLIRDPAAFEKELQLITQFHSGQTIIRMWEEPFFDAVAVPMFKAWWWHKQGEYGKADGWVRCIKADDWRIACQGWIDRRATKREAK